MLTLMFTGSNNHKQFDHFYSLNTLDPVTPLSTLNNRDIADLISYIFIKFSLNVVFLGELFTLEMFTLFFVSLGPICNSTKISLSEIFSV